MCALFTSLMTIIAKSNIRIHVQIALNSFACMSLNFVTFYNSFLKTMLCIPITVVMHNFGVNWKTQGEAMYKNRQQSQDLNRNTSKTTLYPFIFTCCHCLYYIFFKKKFGNLDICQTEKVLNYEND